MAEVAKTFEALRDAVLVEQFLVTCSSKLSVFLRERECRDLDEVASKADVFLEAQVQHGTSKLKSDESAKNSNAASPRDTITSAGRRLLRFFLRNRIGHKAGNCRSRPPRLQIPKCWNCGRTGHRAEGCTFKPSDRHQASCLWADPRKNKSAEIDDGFVTLRNGEKMPVVNTVVGRPPICLSENLTVVEVYVSDRGVSVLRDTGCNTVIVRQELISKEALTGTLNLVFLLDKTVIYLPEAEIVVRTPYFTGKLVGKYVRVPLYNLVLSNIPTVRDVNDPDPNWDSEKQSSQTGVMVSEPLDEKENGMRVDHSKQAQVTSRQATSLGDGEEQSLNTAGAVQAKPGRNQSLPPPPELRAPQVSPLHTTLEELRGVQKNDSTLKKCFDSVGKIVKKHKGRTKYAFFMRSGALYRDCTYSSRRRTEQFVLPKNFRQAVMAMAHYGLMSGHQGVNNTVGLVAEEFFWPRMQSDVKRYVRSSDI